MNETPLLHPSRPERLVLHGAGGTDVGRVRDGNEDRYFISPESGLFMVIDGMGGAAAGERAAAIAFEVLGHRLGGIDGRDAARVRDALIAANNEIWRQASDRAEWRGMGCVATVAVCDGSRLMIGHVGDTRAYTMRRGSLTKITRDHTRVGTQEDQGLIDEAAAMRHPQRHEVMQALGSRERTAGDDFVEIRELPFEPDSALLLCTDGLTDQVPSAELIQIIARHRGDAPAVVQAMIAAANAAGGKDNVSVIWAEGPAFAASANELESSPVRSRTVERNLSRLGLGVMLGASITAIGVYWGREQLAGLVNRSPIASRPQSGSTPDPGADAGRSPRTLVVSTTDKTAFSSVNAAIDNARPGDTIEVQPGEYHERVVVMKPVTLRSTIPREAVIRLPPDPSAEKPGILIQHLGAGSLVGFRLVGNKDSEGVVIIDANVEIGDIELSGWRSAVRITGHSSAVLRGNRFADNVGASIIVEAPATPRLAYNLIEKAAASPASPIELRGGARPVLVDNEIRPRVARPGRGR